MWLSLVSLWSILKNFGKINSVGRALDCGVGGGEFVDSPGPHQYSGSKNNWEMRVPPLPRKRRGDLRLTQMTT